MLFEGGFTFASFGTNLFSIFLFILWLWLLMTVFGDLFRRHDVSGAAKVAWVILLIVLPYIGIFAYLLTQGGGMTERNREQAERAQHQLRRAIGLSAADDVEKLDRLKANKSITEREYVRLRERLVR